MYDGCFSEADPAFRSGQKVPCEPRDHSLHLLSIQYRLDGLIVREYHSDVLWNMFSGPTRPSVLCVPV